MSILGKPGVQDRPGGEFACNSPHLAVTSTMRLPERLQPDLTVGTWGQVLSRGLVPRLSTGTLQLSIRCSSIHFLPSRSFPVSTSGAFEGAAFGSGRSSVGSLP